MSDVIFLGDHARVKPSLVSRFKKAADTVGISVYVAAPLIVAMGMTMPGHAGAALVVPLLGAAIGVLGATIMPVVSVASGVADIFNTSKDSRAINGNEDHRSEQLKTLNESLKTSLGKQSFNQNLSVAAYALAALMMVSTLSSLGSDRGPRLGSVPLAFVVTMAGFYFGRRSYKKALESANYKTAISVIAPPHSPK